ncbi:MAG: dockerin type I repeat-containing protein [Clostridia bacterium]|nr:dockerin type I repeat-containing protein [Clostridia bacterium]
MKKTLALILAFTLAFLPFSAAFAEEAEDEEELICVDAVTYGYLSPFELRTQLVDELPDWLWIEIYSHHNTIVPEIIDDTETPQDSEEITEPYQPYTATKTAAYYDKNGSAAYTLTLQAIFLNTDSGAYCLKADAWYTVISGSWNIETDAPQIKGDTATVVFTVKQLFLGVPFRTENVTLTLRAAGNRSTLPGDADLDGSVTAADARIALRASVGLEAVTQLLLHTADMDRDGRITAADARSILRRAVGLY